MALLLSAKLWLLVLSCFVARRDDLSIAEAKNQVVSQYIRHHAEEELGIKSSSFEISDTGFIRYRKIEGDKTAYYSVKLNQFEDLSYLGDEKAGWLILKFATETVIYQTYNDPSGNVDEMLTEIKIPLKNMGVDDINSLRKTMDTLKKAE